MYSPDLFNGLHLKLPAAVVVFEHGSRYHFPSYFFFFMQPIISAFYAHNMMVHYSLFFPGILRKTITIDFYSPTPQLVINNVIYLSTQAPI